MRWFWRVLTTPMIKRNSGVSFVNAGTATFDDQHHQNAHTVAKLHPKGVAIRTAWPRVHRQEGHAIFVKRSITMRNSSVFTGEDVILRFRVAILPAITVAVLHVRITIVAILALGFGEWNAVKIL